jgi:hypothetical protein
MIAQKRREDFQWIEQSRHGEEEVRVKIDGGKV